MGKPQSTGNLVNAIAQDSSNNIGIGGAANASFKLQVTGSVNLEGNVTTTGAQFVQNGFYLTNANGGSAAGYTNMWGATDGIFFGLRNGTGGGKFIFQSATSYDYTFPAATGTLALTSNLSAYLPLTGGTLTGALSGTSATFSSSVTATQFLIGGTPSNTAGFTNSFYAESAFPSLILKNTSGTVSSISIGLASAGAFGIWNNITSSYFMFFTAAGNVGIGTTAPDYPLVVQANSGGAQAVKLLGRSSDNISILSFHNNANTTQYGYIAGIPTEFRINSGSSIPITFTNADTERMRITSGGNVGIGTTNTIYSALNIKSSGIYLYNGIAVYSTNGTESFLGIGNSGTECGLYATYGASGSYLPITFSTSGTERMRITTDGVIGFYGSSDVANVNDKFSLGYFNSNYGWLQTWSSTALYLNKLGNAVYAGAVRLDTLSDERVKDNIQPIENALSKVLSITGKKFHLKDEDEGKLRYGFIAQELEGILDEFVIQTDITFKHKELEVENVKSIENWASSWAALLVEAIKEQQAQIEELRQIVATK